MKPEDLLDGLEVHPFTRLVWNSQEAREQYQNTINDVLALHDKAEYEMVRQGFRRCATLHLSPHNFHSEIERIEKDGLVWLPIQWTKTYSGFSHKHFQTRPGDPYGSCYGVLTQNIKDAERFRQASGCSDGDVDHRVIGELLGFPACCSEFFINVWDSQYYDSIWQSAKNTANHKLLGERVMEVEGSVYSNQLLRYVGLRSTSHFPCSFDCQQTAEVGKKWVEVMGNIDSVTCKQALDILSMPTVWTCLHGIATIETPAFTIITNSLPTKNRWTVLYSVPGGLKPTETMTLLEADVNLSAIAEDTKRRIKSLRGG